MASVRVQTIVLSVAALLIAIAVLLYRVQRGQLSETAKVSPVASPGVATSSAGTKETGNSTNDSDLLSLIPNEPPPRDFNDALKNASFSDIDAASLYTMLSQIPRSGEALASAEEMQSLLRALEENIWAYKVGSPELIMANRYRTAYSWNSENFAQSRDMLKNRTSVPSNEWPERIEEVMPLLAANMNFGHNGTGYANLYNRLSPEASSIDLKSATRIPPALHAQLSDAARFLGGPRVHLTHTPLPSITYENSADVILKKDGKLLYADVKLAATDAKDEAFYRIKRFYWSSIDATWLLMDMVVVDKPTQPVVTDFFDDGVNTLQRIKEKSMSTRRMLSRVLVCLLAAVVLLVPCISVSASCSDSDSCTQTCSNEIVNQTCYCTSNHCNHCDATANCSGCTSDGMAITSCTCTLS